MLGYKLPTEGRIAKNAKGSRALSLDKVKLVAPDKFLEHFTNRVAFNIIAGATWLPRKVRQRQARLDEQAMRKQEFWQRHLDNAPCTDQARAKGRARGLKLLNELEAEYAQ